MDVLKFAFEIMIVGALALPWLVVVIRIFFSDAASGKPIDFKLFPSPVSEQAQQAIAIALIIATGYLLGSAVSRISRNLFNDKLLGNFLSLPTEDRIRRAVYREEYCEKKLLRFRNLPCVRKDQPPCGEWMCQQTNNGTDTKEFDEVVQEMFRLQEGELLLEGKDKVDRLKEYYDQITVLRGAALNGFILFALCSFGALGNRRAASSSSILKVLMFLPAGAVVLCGAYSLWYHVHNAGTLYSHSPLAAPVGAPPLAELMHKAELVHKADVFYVHPPLAELVLLLLGVVGFFVISKARREKFYVPTLLVAAILTLVSFGGWWWTEVMYDHQVIHSAPELQLDRKTPPAEARTP